jgi:hypothetical protein
MLLLAAFATADGPGERRVLGEFVDEARPFLALYRLQATRGG